MTRNPSTLSHLRSQQSSSLSSTKALGVPCFGFQSDQKKTSFYLKMKALAEGFFADVDIPKRFFSAAIRSRRSATSVLALNLGLFVGDALENDDVLCMK